MECGPGRAGPGGAERGGRGAGAGPGRARSCGRRDSVAAPGPARPWPRPRPRSRSRPGCSCPCCSWRPPAPPPAVSAAPLPAPPASVSPHEPGRLPPGRGARSCTTPAVSRPQAPGPRSDPDSRPAGPRESRRRGGTGGRTHGCDDALQRQGREWGAAVGREWGVPAGPGGAMGREWGAPAGRGGGFLASPPCTCWVGADDAPPRAKGPPEPDIWGWLQPSSRGRGGRIRPPPLRSRGRFLAGTPPGPHSPYVRTFPDPHPRSSRILGPEAALPGHGQGLGGPEALDGGRQVQAVTPPALGPGATSLPTTCALDVAPRLEELTPPSTPPPAPRGQAAGETEALH